MRSLSEHVVVPVEDPSGRRAQLVYAPHEHLRLVPYAFSALRLALFGLLVIGTCGILGIVSVWFPQLFTRIARAPLPYSRVGEADYVLALVHEDGFRSQWVEVKVHRPAGHKHDQPKQASTSTTASGYQEVTTPSTTATAIATKLPWVWFEFKKHRYVFNHEKGEFERYLSTVHEELDKIRARLDVGLDDAAHKTKVELFGRNLVDIDAPFIPKLIFKKVVHPFYLFQVFSAVVWFNQDYTVYAIVILVLSAISMTWEIYSEVSNSNRLRGLVKSDHKVQVFRAGASSAQKMVTLHETDLVPGDIVELTTGPVVADVLLLSGGCVVDEASLTGEAVPINKEAVRGGGREVITETGARVTYKMSFLHAGSTITRVRDASGPCKGVVLSTGFSTGKGELFRSILFPRTITFEFERDSYRYLAVLATIALVAFTKRVVNFSDQGYDFYYMIVNSLDLITITVPPALPLVLSSGNGFALARLKKGGIFCIDAQRINSCGQLDTFCFDKTGTLTEESLQLVGVDVVARDTQQFARIDTSVPSFAVAQLPEQFRLAMATCHSLSEVDGELQGYSLELSMFAKAAVPLEFVHDRRSVTGSVAYLAVATMASGSDGSATTTFGVIKRFPFDAACQRSSVVVENAATKQRFVYVKGSPEAVSAIARDTPADFAATSLRYAADGNYCIGFGVRELPPATATATSGVLNVNVDDRAAIERDVQFMGIALFHNELKPESRAMLRELYDASIDVRVITGDNALTAVHVGRLLDMPLKSRVAIVDVNADDDVVFHCVEALRSTDTQQWTPLTDENVTRVLSEYDVALTGAALEQLQTRLSDESMRQLLLQTQIFARTRPTLKAWIVERLMDYGKIVGMCGDGTNDCGALKAAHVGLALSSAEASIVAPFTSKAKAVTDVPVLIREGRCALTTSFLGFKYMVLYPIIQMGMATVLGDVGTMMSNNQYLWDDLAIVLGLSISMLYTSSSDKLTKERPPHSLFSLTIVASILGQVALFVTFFASMFAIMAHKSWYCRRSDGMDLVTAFLEDPSYVNETAFEPTVIQNCQFYTAYVDQIELEVDDIAEAHEDSMIWLYVHMFYFSVALAFNLKDRFRKPFYTNGYFVGFFLVSFGVNLWFLLDTSNVIAGSFSTLPLDASFRWTMFAMFAAQFVLAQVWELLATWTLPQWRLARTAANGDTKTSDAGHVVRDDYVELPDDGASVLAEKVPTRS